MKFALRLMAAKTEYVFSRMAEWAYYRGECGPAAQESPTPAAAVEATAKASGGTEEIVDWWGIIKNTGSGAQYDDYFERQDLGQVIYFGIDSMDPAATSQIEALRDSGKILHLYGKLLSNVPDYNGSQIQWIASRLKGNYHSLMFLGWEVMVTR